MDRVLPFGNDPRKVRLSVAFQFYPVEGAMVGTKA
jgi:hypothetical protein